MKFGMKIDYKHSYKLYMNIVYKSTIANMMVVQNFQVISGKFNIVRILK